MNMEKQQQWKRHFIINVALSSVFLFIFLVTLNSSLHSFSPCLLLPSGLSFLQMPFPDSGRLCLLALLSAHLLQSFSSEFESRPSPRNASKATMILISYNPPKFNSLFSHLATRSQPIKSLPFMTLLSLDGAVGTSVTEHFLLVHHEILGNADSVAIPWDASAWCFFDQGLASYDLAHKILEVLLDSHLMQAFLTELVVLLRKWNLVKILCICASGGKFFDGLAIPETTSGRQHHISF